MFHILVRPQSGGSCVYDGDYTQNGRLGHSKGNYNCTDGTFGTYNIDRIEANLDGLVARFSASNNYCTSITGSIGAVSK